jgi:hypothetical protein
MEINNEKQIFNYLSKNYFIRNNTFIEKPDNIEYGRAIVDILSIIFSLDFDFCENNFKLWAYNNGFPENQEIWSISYNPQRLKTKWCVDPSFTSENESIRISKLAKEISKEIDAQILKDLVTSSMTADEFFEILKCVGYKAGPLLYNPYDFMPFKSIISMTYDELTNERQNSIHWKNWLQSRRQNTET